MLDLIHDDEVASLLDGEHMLSRIDLVLTNHAQLRLDIGAASHRVLRVIGDDDVDHHEIICIDGYLFDQVLKHVLLTLRELALKLWEAYKITITADPYRVGAIPSKFLLHLIGAALINSLVAVITIIIGPAILLVDKILFYLAVFLLKKHIL